MSNLVEAVAVIERCTELELLQLDALIAVRLSLFQQPSFTISKTATKGPKSVQVPKVASKTKNSPPKGNPTKTNKKKCRPPTPKCHSKAATVPPPHPPPNGPTLVASHQALPVYQVKNPFLFSVPLDDSNATPSISEQEHDYF